MRDNHGIRYNPTNKTLVAVADGGEQLHQKQTGEYFLVARDDTITPLTHESAVRWMNRYCGGVVTRANTSQKNNRIIVTVPAELAHAFQHGIPALKDITPKQYVMDNLDHEIAKALPPVKVHGTRSIGLNVTPEEDDLIRLKAAEHGLSKRAFIARLVTELLYPGQY